MVPARYIVRRLWLSGLPNKIQLPVGAKLPAAGGATGERKGDSGVSQLSAKARQGKVPAAHGFSFHPGETLQAPPPQMPAR
jgi:hypothetical protein